MICSHCGKNLENDKLSFCVYCGYPLKGEKKGFFAKSEETGTSRADELSMAEVRMPEPAEPVSNTQTAPQMPSVSAPQPAASAVNGGAPMVQNIQPAAPAMGSVMPGTQPAMPQMAAQPVMPGIPGGAVPQMGGVQPMMQGMPQMGGVQPMMQGMPQMGVQPMQGAEAMQSAQMGYGMPQMGYGMPQMQYMPQFAGYDAAGNPVYMQMVPQLMGYDAYGNPVYNMVAMPYVMPQVNGVPMVQPVMPAVTQEPVIDVPQEQIRPAEAAPQPQAMPQMPQAPQIPQAPAMPSAPAPQPQPTAAAHQQVAQSIQAAQALLATGIGAPKPVAPVQEIPQQQPFIERSVAISSAEDIPMDADALMREEENGEAQKSGLPDEAALLDSIFSDAPKNYSMSSGTAPAAATFSINVAADEVINVRDEEAAAPPVPVLTPEEKPGKPAAPKTEKAAKAEKKAAKEAAKESAKKKKQPVKKAPATIVSPDEFFNDKPRKRRDTISVNDLDQLDDDQLAAALATMQTTSTGKKSTRSMKAASRDEMDVSNMDEESLHGAKNPTLPQ